MNKLHLRAENWQSSGARDESDLIAAAALLLLKEVEVRKELTFRLSRLVRILCRPCSFVKADIEDGKASRKPKEDFNTMSFAQLRTIVR